MCTRASISVAFPMRFAQLCELFLLCVINAATGFSHFFSANTPVNLCLLDVRTRILGLNLPTTVLISPLNLTEGNNDIQVVAWFLPVLQEHTNPKH